MHVLLVDDHTLFREGMRLLIAPLVQPLEVDEAGSCEEVQALLAGGARFDLVLMDLGLPGASGLEGIAWLKAAHPGLPVVALSSSDDRETVLKALDAGAMGFIPKSASSSVMLAALRLVMARGIYLPPSVFLPGLAEQAKPPLAEAMLPTTMKGAVDTEFNAKSDANLEADLQAALGLSPRQAEVLDLLLQGQSAKVIGRELGLAPSTVKTHTSAVLRALNVTTRTQAIIAASRLGWRFSR